MLHPYLQATPFPAERLSRAYFWSVIDADFRHGDYWRGQIEEARAGLVAWAGDRTADVALWDRRSMIEGYEMASKCRRQVVALPVGFESGSVCNTRTLSNGLDS